MRGSQAHISTAGIRLGRGQRGRGPAEARAGVAAGAAMVAEALLGKVAAMVLGRPPLLGVCCYWTAAGLADSVTAVRAW
eukprot:scaffold565_cov358-Prasinococcus_capsulatus_cf.AAC.10